MVVDLLDVGHARHVDAHRALGLLDSAVREHHVVRRHERAVVELDIAPQFKANLGGAHESPLRGQRGLHFVLVVVANQAFVGVLQDGVGGGVVLRVRVQGQNIVLGGPTQGLGLGWGGQGSSH